MPLNAGVDPETLLRHTSKIATKLLVQAETRPRTRAEAIVVTLDSTFIRSSEAGEQHLEVRIGNAETSTGESMQRLGGRSPSRKSGKLLGCGSEGATPVPKLVWRVTLVAGGRGGDGD